MDSKRDGGVQAVCDTKFGLRKGLRVGGPIYAANRSTGLVRHYTDVIILMGGKGFILLLNFHLIITYY